MGGSIPTTDLVPLGRSGPVECYVPLTPSSLRTQLARSRYVVKSNQHSHRNFVKKHPICVSGYNNGMLLSRPRLFSSMLVFHIVYIFGLCYRRITRPANICAYFVIVFYSILITMPGYVFASPSIVIESYPNVHFVNVNQISVLVRLNRERFLHQFLDRFEIQDSLAMLLVENIQQENLSMDVVSGRTDINSNTLQIEFHITLRDLDLSGNNLYCCIGAVSVSLTRYNTILFGQRGASSTVLWTEPFLLNSPDQQICESLIVYLEQYLGRLAVGLAQSAPN